MSVWMPPDKKAFPGEKGKGGFIHQIRASLINSTASTQCVNIKNYFKPKVVMYTSLIFLMTIYQQRSKRGALQFLKASR